MKKVGLIILLVVGIVTAFMITFMSNEIVIEEDKSGFPGDTDVKTIQEDDIHKGNLVLINENYPVEKEGVKNDIQTFHPEDFKGVQLLDQEIQLSQSISQKFMDMAEDAQHDGVDSFTITSGYRGIEAQTLLFKEMGEDYALPGGYSEHNSGLAMDVGSTEGLMANASEGKWIEDNAWKHGFILRYPENKTSITGIEYEPWHIRYVGLPHSALMYEHDFVLEEYLDYVKDQKELYASFEGKEYFITYYPYGENQQIELPVDHEYMITGDNMNGVIVTVTM
ncbi:M15 family metallopeptidase [Oceanobacillus jordanicus]|uniref:M15 family metallopeptidase n=1 Tax=Oceanobacillus jordanicus TaxID=2867266 RepID=A0AAW5BA56_9BACI|nr:M15 family metallopeptidase [Oceanobacillus jordanicus]MCG3421216.1 M15 family metallopeptidase [Oceanobacillus jordanicus]